MGIGPHCYGELNLIGLPPFSKGSTRYLGLEMLTPFTHDTYTTCEAKALVKAQIRRSLAALHNKGIFHGDVKSSNLCLKKDKVVFVDFEFATSLKTTRRGGGTRWYRRRDYSPFSPLERMSNVQRDLFALGIIFIEIHRMARIHTLLPQAVGDVQFRDFFEGITRGLVDSRRKDIHKLLGLQTEHAPMNRSKP